MSRKPSAFAIFAVLDLVFMLLCTVAFSIFLYTVNNGGFRMYLLCGVIAGMTVYRYTVGRLVIFAAEKSIGAVRRAIMILVVRPIGRLAVLGCRLIRFVISNTVGRLWKLLLKQLGVMRTGRAMRRIERDIRFS